ncbi:MAG: GNAT family N-acetyltransferase [Dehalococcoidia bacterium]
MSKEHQELDSEWSVWGLPVHLEPVTRDYWQQVIELDIADDQRRFIREPTLLYVIAEAQFYPNYTPHAIYVNDAVIGFVSYGSVPGDPMAWWIPLLLIDHRYQGKDYGRAALQLVLRRIQEAAPNCREVGRYGSNTSNDTRC